MLALDIVFVVWCEALFRIVGVTQDLKPASGSMTIYLRVRVCCILCVSIRCCVFNFSHPHTKRIRYSKEFLKMHERH